MLAIRNKQISSILSRWTTIQTVMSPSGTTPTTEKKKLNIVWKHFIQNWSIMRIWLSVADRDEVSPIYFFSLSAFSLAFVWTENQFAHRINKNWYAEIYCPVRLFPVTKFKAIPLLLFFHSLPAFFFSFCSHLDWTLFKAATAAGGRKNIIIPKK